MWPRQQVPRQDGELCRETVYGLVEWEEERIRQSRLVAPPGCFLTASLLALFPFLKQGLIELDGIVINAKTGSSCGGRAAKEHLLLAEAGEAVMPYGVVGQRHTNEIEQMASQLAGQAIQLQFLLLLQQLIAHQPQNGGVNGEYAAPIAAEASASSRSWKPRRTISWMGG
jgi:N-acetyl-gamma-glutamyl-phosphate reductase